MTSRDRITRTPCDFPPCDDGPGEPCGRHERDQAHAEGEHALCGYECTAGDFGHRPEWRDVGQCGMPDCQCPDHEEREVCARCHINRYRSDWVTCFNAAGEKHRVYGSWLVAVKSIAWPCATAVVLGLTVREPAP